MLGHDLQIPGDGECELPRGETGEIVGYALLLMTRHHGNPAATGAALSRDPASGRSFLRSGGVGLFDLTGTSPWWAARRT